MAKQLLDCTLVAEQPNDGFDPLRVRETTIIRSSDQELNDRLVAMGVPPVSCANVMRRFRATSEAAAADDPNEGKLYGRYTSVDPRFWISLHRGEFDAVRFEIFGRGQYYEKALSNAFREVLSSQSAGDTRVLDVGGNIGWFSLLSAALGATVASFEPNDVNYLRTCESMCLSGWLKGGTGANCLGVTSESFLQKHIHIFPYAVSDVSGTIHFEAHTLNPGQGQVMTTKSRNSIALKAVTLDGMVDALGWSDKRIDILKVDVEGAEANVFKGAKSLLRSNHVENIFMEGNIRNKEEVSKFEEIAKLLVKSGYVIYMEGGWMGPNELQRVPSLTYDDGFFLQLKKLCGENIQGKKRDQCNLWWKPASFRSSGVTKMSA